MRSQYSFLLLSLLIVGCSSQPLGRDELLRLISKNSYSSSEIVADRPCSNAPSIEDENTRALDGILASEIDGAVFALRNIEALMGIQECTAILTKASEGKAPSQKQLQADVQSLPRAYRDILGQKLMRNSEATDRDYRIHSQQSAITSSLNRGLSATEACVLEYGHWSWSYTDHSAKVQNRIAHLQKCAPQRKMRKTEKQI